MYTYKHALLQQYMCGDQRMALQKPYRFQELNLGCKAFDFQLHYFIITAQPLAHDSVHFCIRCRSNCDTSCKGPANSAAHISISSTERPAVSSPVINLPSSGNVGDWGRFCFLLRSPQTPEHVYTHIHTQEKINVKKIRTTQNLLTAGEGSVGACRILATWVQSLECMDR